MFKKSHTKPVLLRTMQLVLHSEIRRTRSRNWQLRTSRRIRHLRLFDRSLPVMRRVHSQSGWVGRCRATVSIANATFPPQARPHRSPMQVHGAETGLNFDVGDTGNEMRYARNRSLEGSMVVDSIVIYTHAWPVSEIFRLLFSKM